VNSCADVNLLTYLQISVPVPCENGSVETTVAEGGQNPCARLWGCTRGENWPKYWTQICEVL